MLLLRRAALVFPVVDRLGSAEIACAVKRAASLVAARRRRANVCRHRTPLSPLGCVGDCPESTRRKTPASQPRRRVRGARQRCHHFGHIGRWLSLALRRGRLTHGSYPVCEPRSKRGRAEGFETGVVSGVVMSTVGRDTSRASASSSSHRWSICRRSPAEGQTFPQLGRRRWALRGPEFVARGADRGFDARPAVRTVPSSPSFSGVRTS